MRLLLIAFVLTFFTLSVRNLYSQCEGCPKSYDDFFSEINHDNVSFFDDGLNDDLNKLEICNSKLVSCEELNFNCFNVVTFCFKNKTDLFLKKVKYILKIKDPSGKILFSKKYSINKEMKPNESVPIEIPLPRNIKTRFNFLENQHFVIFERQKIIIDKMKVAEYIVQKGIDANDNELFTKSIEMAKEYDPKIEYRSIVKNYLQESEANIKTGPPNNIKEAWHLFKKNLESENVEKLKYSISFPLYFYNSKKEKNEIIKEEDFNKNFKKLFTLENKDLIFFEDGSDIYSQKAENIKDYPNLILGDNYFWFVSELDTDTWLTLIFNSNYKLVRIEF